MLRRLHHIDSWSSFTLFFLKSRIKLRTQIQRLKVFSEFCPCFTTSSFILLACFLLDVLFICFMSFLFHVLFYFCWGQMLFVTYFMLLLSRVFPFNIYTGLPPWQWYFCHLDLAFTSLKFQHAMQFHDLMKIYRTTVLFFTATWPNLIGLFLFF